MKTNKTTKSTETKFDIYEMVTNMIIEKLEEGIIPWKKGWTGSWDSAISRSTGKPYSFINQMLLGFKAGEFLTFKQVQDAKGTIKKGAKSHVVVFYSPKQIKEKNVQTGEEEIKTIPILKYYRVFHINDCENVEPKYAKDDLEVMRTFNSILNAEKLAMHYSENQKMPIIHKKGDRAFYRPATDTVTMPEKEQFLTSEDYYSTLFHELTHSTGAKHRLDRIKGSAFGDVKYSKEELVAEIGASYCMNLLGIETAENFENQTAYIGSWLKKLKSDKKFIISASSQAEKAVNMITENFELDYEVTEENSVTEIIEEVVYCDEQIDTKLKPQIEENTICVDAKEFYNAIEKVNQIKIKKTTFPALLSCEISVFENEIALHRSNLEVDITSNVKCEVSENLQGKVFNIQDSANLSKALKSTKGELKITVKDTYINFENNSNSFRYLGKILKEKEVPEMVVNVAVNLSNPKSKKDIETFKIKNEILKSRLQKVWYACSVENSKPVHTGVLFDGENLVAVDGYRLAINTGEKLNNEKFVIQKSSLEIITKAFKKEEVSITKITDKYVMFSTENSKIVARVLEGEFLNYQNAMTDYSSDEEKEISSSEFLQCINTICTVTSKKDRVPVVIENQMLEITTSAGAFHSEMSENVFSLNSKKRGFNPFYLQDVLKTCESEKITTQAKNGDLTPILITDDKTKHLVLPIRIRSEEN